jgi:hypothetical protein
VIEADFASVFSLPDLGMARTTPLPDRQTLDMILDKLQKCVFHNLYMLIMPTGISFMVSCCCFLIPQEGYVRRVCRAGGS